MAASAALRLPLPTATPRCARPPIGVPALSLGLSRVSISGTGALALRPLVRRHREESSRVVARAGESGEEAEEEAGEEESGDAAAVAVVEEKVPKKPTVKLNEIIGVLNKRFIEELETIKPVPDIRPGDIIELKKQKANRRRLALYKGIVIAKNSAGVHTTIRIRYMTSGTAVEIVFPVYSPTIKEIKVVSHRDVRRAKLFYLREKLPRFYTFKKK